MYTAKYESLGDYWYILDPEGNFLVKVNGWDMEENVDTLLSHLNRG
jgi:hypothetical protein